jgi:ubiquinone/menaquinone biosynthesis C-methylase UbiE
MTGCPPPHLSAALASAHSLQEIEPGIWLQPDAVRAGAAQYDTIGTAYELVGGLDIYHRLFWGVSTRAYRAFAEKAMLACGNGTMLDAGCGSMLFTAGAYQASEGGAVIGTDASLTMLRLARARLDSYGQQSCVALLSSDLRRSPFRSGVFDVVTCLHVTHVLDDLTGLLGEIRRILKPRGRLFLTSVVAVNHCRDLYLRALCRRGVMASPRHREDILTAIYELFGTDVDSSLVGSMLFVEAASPHGRA